MSIPTSGSPSEAFTPSSERVGTDGAVRDGVVVVARVGERDGRFLRTLRALGMVGVDEGRGARFRAPGAARLMGAVGVFGDGRGHEDWRERQTESACCWK